MERYWNTQVELVSALKEDAMSSSLVALVVKMKQAENVFVMNVEGVFPSEPKKNVSSSISASASSPIFSLLHYAQAIQAALASLGTPHDFDPLQEFQLHLEGEYKGFRQDQIQRIQEFRWKKNDTLRTIYIRLVRFARESRGIFAES